MKTTKYIKLLASLLVCLVFVTVSCNKEIPWEPGPQPAADNPGVFFDQSNPNLIERSQCPGRTFARLFDHFGGQRQFKAASALSVPVTVHYADPSLTVEQKWNLPQVKYLLN